MSDIRLINSMIDRGILQRYNDGYAMEHNGREGIQTEEIVPEEMNGEAGYQAQDVLDYVVYNVDNMPVIESYERIISESEKEIASDYIDKFRIRIDGKHILRNGIIIEPEIIKRSEEGYIASFLSENSQPVMLDDGRIVSSNPEAPVFLNNQGFLRGGLFDEPVLFEDIPLLGDVYADGANYSNYGGGLYTLLFEDQRELETSLGSIQYKYYSWNKDLEFSIFTLEDEVFHYHQDVIRLSEDSRINFYFDTMTPKYFSSFEEMLSTVSLPDGRRINAMTGTLKGVSYYPDGTLEACYPEEDLALVINGQKVTHKANNEIIFYQDGNVSSFIAREPVVMELITGEQGEVSTSFIGVSLDDQGRVYRARLNEYYLHHSESGSYYYKYIEFDKKTGEFISGSP